MHSRSTYPRTTLVALAVASCFAGAAHANPAGPTVMHGTASFNAVGNALNITNSPNAIINWRGFSVGASEITRFIQNSAASSVLNRVTGAESSRILGQLLSNGRVMLINPNGVFIGGGAVVDVAGFTASSLKISDADFLAGKYTFTDQVGAARIVNQGSIRTPEGGQVYLIAPNVENSGVITSPSGQVILAAGKTVELVDAGSPDVRVEFTAPDNAAVNIGKVVAGAGRVGIYGTTIGHSGVVRANSAQVGESGRIVFKATKDITLEAGSRIEANGPSGGSVTVQAEAGTLLASGVVEAKGEGDKGGTVQLMGNQVGLIGDAKVDASGDLGGGTVLVGGDRRGENPDVQNAWRTYLGPAVTVRADAVDSGDGGKVIVWSDDITRFYGNISARGGARSGNGGFAEVSGKEFLVYRGTADLSAPFGHFGTLLLDPRDITIQALGTDNNQLDANVPGVEVAGQILFGAATSTDFTLTAGTVSGSSANIVLQAQRDININASVTLNNDLDFVAQAGHDINVNAALTTNGVTAGEGRIHLEADSPHSGTFFDGAGAVNINANVNSCGGAAGGCLGGNITLIGGGNSSPNGGFNLNAGVQAGDGGINVALSSGGELNFFVGAGGNTQLSSNDTGFLQTTGPLVLGKATTAGSDGNGSGALTLTVSSITNSTATPIQLSADSGSSFELYATGDITLSRPLTTYQDTVIDAGGTLTINETLATSDNNLTLTAANVVLGSSGSVNIGSGSCTGTACTTLGIDTSQIFWDGEGLDGDWFNASNWKLSSTNPNNVLPDSTRDVTIDTTTGFGTIQITGGAATAKSLVAGRPIELSSGSLELANASTFSDALTFSGGTLLGAGGVSIGGASGALTWSGGTAATSAGTFLLVSGHSGTLSNALSLNRPFQNDGALTLNGATVTGTAGSITNNGTLTATGTNSVDKMLLALGSIGGTGSLTVNDWSRTGGVFDMTVPGPSHGIASLRVPTGNFTVDQTYSAGNLTLLAPGGDIAVNAAVTASGNLTLSSTGAVTQIAAITASGLELLGTGGSYTLTYTGNNIATLAADTGSVSYTDSNALTVGTVNTTTGINATGLVDVRTQTGDLTLSNGIATTDTTANAVTLVADVAAAPDATGSGGNFKNNAGAAAINTGGAWRVYTGNPTGTTRGGLVEAGKRYNVDDGSDPIASGNRIYFRIQPTVSVTANAQSKTYGDLDPTLTYVTSGTLIDGDTTFSPTGALTRATGETVADGPYAISLGTLSSQLGYALNFAGANLTIDQRAITLAANAASKTYGNADPTLSVSIAGGTLASVAVSDTLAQVTGTVGRQAGETVAGGPYDITLGSGTKAGNYAITFVADNNAFTIDPRAITGSITAANKVYDANDLATIATRTLSGAIGGDAVSYTGGAALFSDKNVADGKTVTATGLSLSGADASNYTVNATATTTANITAATLTATGFTAQNKVYDATTAATVSGGTLGGVFSGDVVSLVGLSGSFADKNVGTGKTVTVSGGTLSGADAGNYTVNATATTTANITALGITGSITAANKVYDANATATIASRTLSGAIGGDAVSYTGGTALFSDKNVANGKTVTATGLSLSGADAGNYTVNATATTTANITAATLTATGFTAQNKVYDATTAATVSGGTLGGVFSGDVVSLAGLTGSFANKNVGTGKTVTVSGGTLSGADAGNYQLTSASGSTTANITPATLTATSFTAQDKVYDATTAATVSGGTLGGVFSGDVVSLAGLSGSFADKNVGTGKTVTVSGGALAGTDAGNYQLSFASGSTTASITPATLTATGFTAQNKVYDATTAATVSGGTLGGVFGGDVVSLAGLSGSFADKNVGAGKTVTVSGGTLSGADAGNYQLTSASGSTTASITPATLTATSFAAQNKVYDATTAATVSGGTLGGVFSGDVVSLVGLSGSFADKNVGTGKTVTVSGGTLGGADAGNYQLTAASGSTTASITPATLTVAGFTAQNKVYDATTAATVSGGPLGGVFSGDAVSLTSLAGSFADKNVGTGKTVTVSGGTLGGADSGNYQLTSASGSTTASITPAPLLITAATNTKTYDGNTGASATPAVSGLVNGDTATGVAEVYSDPDAGTGKTLLVSGYTINDGNGGANYSVTLINDTTGVITQAAPTPIAGSSSAVQVAVNSTTNQINNSVPDTSEGTPVAPIKVGPGSKDKDKDDENLAVCN